MNETTAPAPPAQFQANVQLKLQEEYQGTPLVYSNAVVVSLTQNDITIHFSYYTLPVFGAPPASDTVREVTAAPAVSVALPPAVAQALVGQLEQQLEAIKTINMRPAAPAST